MAAATLTLLHVDTSRRRISRTYKVTFPAGANTALDVDLTAALNPNLLGNAGWARNPDGFRVDNPPECAIFTLDPGTGLTNWSIEQTSGDYSADADVRITLSGPIGV